MSADDPTLAPEVWERLRQSGLRLDREGRWWHEGEAVEHPGLVRALHRWLDRLADGRYVVRFTAEAFAYVEVEDAPRLVRSLRREGTGAEARVFLYLSDEREEELPYATLRVGAGGALYCRLRGGLEARFTRPAHYLLGEMIEESGSGFVLAAAGARWPVGTR